MNPWMDPPFDGISISVFHFHVIGKTVPSLCHFIFSIVTYTPQNPPHFILFTAPSFYSYLIFQTSVTLWIQIGISFFYRIMQYKSFSDNLSHTVLFYLRNKDMNPLLDSRKSIHFTHIRESAFFFGSTPSTPSYIF